MGGQITDLLREVPYNRKERGIMCIQPYHLNFRPIRRHIMETIEVQFSEQDGTMVKFDNKQTSSITLLFKNVVWAFKNDKIPLTKGIVSVPRSPPIVTLIVVIKIFFPVILVPLL